MNWLKQHKKTAWLSVSAVVAILVVALVVYFHERDNKANAQGDSKQQTGPLRVKVIQPKEGGVERLVKRPGTVQSFQFADLYAKVSGYLRNQDKRDGDKPPVDIGYKTKQGEVLAEVYVPELFKNVEKAGADVKKARANAKAAEARVDKAKADQQSAESQYEQSKADVEKGQAMLSLRGKQYNRYKELAAKSSVQQELVDEKLEARLAAESSLNAYKKAVQTAQSGITSAKASVEQAKADVADAEAAVSVAKATLDRAEVLAKYTQITSPYDGVVTKRNFHDGDFIRDASEGSSKPVLAVARTDKMRILIEAPDRAIPYLKKGDAVTMTIGTLQDRHFTGTVARMAYSEEYDTRTMRTEVDMLNPDGLLKNGMYGEVTIHLGREKGLRIPSSCLFGNEKDEERSVFVVRDDKAAEVKVKVGSDDGIEVTIREGLSASDQVVVERPSGLSDGMAVEVLQDSSADKAVDKAEKDKASDKKEKGPAADNDKSSENKAKSTGK